MELFRPGQFPDGVAGIADVALTRPIHTLEVAFAHKIGRKLVVTATSLQASTAIAYGA